MNGECACGKTGRIRRGMCDTCYSRWQRSRTPEERQRLNIGSNRPNARLTEEIVQSIRERYAAGEIQPVLAAEFGLTSGAVSNIVNGKYWKHAGGPIQEPGRRGARSAAERRQITGEPEPQRPPCSIQGCGYRAKTRGLCSTHYTRLRTGYDMDAPLARRYAPDAELFWALVDKSAGPDGCWSWTGPLNADGYGMATVPQAKGRRGNGAHRAAWVWTHGDLPERGMQLDHTCHSRALDECPGGRGCLHRRCCNPSHLEVVTTAVNTMRSHAPSRYFAERTHCGHGHLLSGSNLSRRPDGSRRCRRCGADASARYKAKKLRRAA